MNAEATGAIELIRDELRRLADANRARIVAYVRDGGREHHYPDGKEFAYDDAISVVERVIAGEPARLLDRFI